MKKRKSLHHNKKAYNLAMCSLLFFGLGVLLYIWGVSSKLAVNFELLITENIVFALYFMVAILNLYSFLVLFYLKKYIEQISHAFFIFNSILVCLSTIFTINYITAAILLYFCYKMYKKNHLSFKTLKQEHKKDKNYFLTWVNLGLYLMMITIIYLTIFELL